jgi:hypothetical protein
MTDHPGNPREVNLDERDNHLLGLAPGATVEQINTAYRRALRRTHPDTAPDDPRPTRQGPCEPCACLRELQTARARLLATAAGQAPGSSPPATDHPPTTASTRYIAPGWSRRERRSAPPAHRPDLIAGPVRYHGPTRAASARGEAR